MFYQGISKHVSININFTSAQWARQKSVGSLFAKRKIEAKCLLCISSRGQDPLALSLLLQVLTELPSGDRSIAYVLHKMAMLCKYKDLCCYMMGVGEKDLLGRGDILHQSLPPP